MQKIKNSNHSPTGFNRGSLGQPNRSTSGNASPIG